MSSRLGLARAVVAAAALVLLSTPAAHGQQPVAQPPQNQEPQIIIHRIDLNPTGSIFSMDVPKLEDGKWVFHILPERTLERLPQERVKAIVRRTRDFDKVVNYLIEFEPTGQILATEEPVKKGSTYIIKTFKGGNLMSVKQADVKKITRLTGMEAFKAEEIELGVVLMTGEPIMRSDAPSGASPGSGSAAPPASAPASGNWQYQGVPGATDAYAPANATVDRPGDVPKAPTPARPPN